MTRLGLASASLIVSLLFASVSFPVKAWAQTDPPPVSADAPAAAPAPPAPPAATLAPPAATPPAPAPAATATPPPAPAPPPSLSAPAPTAEPGTLPPLPPPEERPPIYKQTWFWGVAAVVGLTAIMIAYGLGSQGPATPNTDLGNMRAF